MLQKFSVRNYKNFKDVISIDFSKVGGYKFNQECVSDNVLGKMLIYGRNATGKTNLGYAIMDIKAILWSDFYHYDSFMVNADSECKTVDFNYIFLFGDDKLEYSYRRDVKRELISEELLINEEEIFDINFEEKKFIFHLERINAETLVTDVYINAHCEKLDDMDGESFRLPFLRWLLSNAALNSSSCLLQMSSYIKGMRLQSIVFSPKYLPQRTYELFFDILSQDGNLKEFEAFLNDMGIECELDLQELPDGKKELYFKHDQPIPFMENASSGTIALMNMYRAFIMSVMSASFIYMDEFDAFYHYEMSNNVIQYLKKRFPKCQIIMTTHNTNLMNNRLMRPDCLFILSRDGRLTALCDATQRELREGHNLEKMYISGEFEKYE